MFILQKLEEWLLGNVLSNHVADTEFQFKIKYTLEERKALSNKSSNMGRKMIIVEPSQVEVRINPDLKHFRSKICCK